MTTRLSPCPSCGRHRFVRDLACPFCASRSAMLGVAFMAAGCVTAPEAPTVDPITTDVPEVVAPEVVAPEVEAPADTDAPAAADTDAPPETEPVEAKVEPKKPKPSPVEKVDPGTISVEVREVVAVYGPPPPRNGPPIERELILPEKRTIKPDKEE